MGVISESGARPFADEEWLVDGNIQHHNDIAGNGYSSPRFMCDFGDKQ